jgi:hypothetical protein
MSYTMLSSGAEPQGLLMGVVKPSQITKVWIRKPGSENWVEYDRKEYLEKQDVYNRRRVLDQYEEDRFVDVGIDLSNPKIQLDDFIDVVFDADGPRGKETPEETKARFINY